MIVSPASDEVWRCAPGYEGFYEVSSHGRMRRVETQRVLKPQLTPTGYLIVGPSILGVAKSVSLHRLVARAFLGEPVEPTDQVNHRNGIKTDCSVNNLEWCTAKENMAHAIATGLAGASIPPRFSGSEHPRSLLDEASVRLIRSSTEPRRVLAERYGVTPSAIKAVRARRNWAHVL